MCRLKSEDTVSNPVELKYRGNEIFSNTKIQGY